MDQSLLERLEQDRPSSVMVMGAPDSGKTTLIEQLLRAWRPGGAIAVMDCDIGQSRLGPPTTIAWGVAPQPCTGWSAVPVAAMAFAGAVSPDAIVPAFLAQAVKMAETARRAAAHLVIDTTGLVAGPIGVALKREKVRQLQPDLIVALAAGGELDELLAQLDAARTIRLRPLADLQRRSQAQRSAYRSRQLARYFMASALASLDLHRVPLTGLGPDWPAGTVDATAASLIGRVVGLRDRAGGDVALGLVRDVDPATHAAKLLTPLRDLAGVAQVAVGSLRWPEEPSGD